MKKNIFLSASALILLLVSATFANATTGESSAWNAVTYDSTISFSATLNADGSVSTAWSKYNHAEAFTYYKLVRSQSNNNPVYPDDGYIFYGGDVNELTYTDSEVPDGTSYYRICEIASPQRYCSAKVVTINKTAGTTTSTETTTTEPSVEKPVPTLYTAEPVTMVQGFEDLPADHWSADCVEKLAGDEIVKSGEGTYFRPEDSVNRAEFLKLVMTAYYPDVSKYENLFCFTDVGPSAWYTGYVCSAAAQGMVSGYTDNYYRPAKNITRAEGAAILVKALHVPVIVWEGVPFTDVIADWQKTVVAMAYKKQLVNGYNQTQFGPNDLLTRAQAAKLICNARDNFTAPLAGPVPVIESSEAVNPPDEYAHTDANTITVTGSSTRSAPLIINHTNTGISSIPESFITSAKAFFRIAYGHTSHGSQLVTGMSVLEQGSSLYSYDANGGEGVLYLNEDKLTGDLGGDWEPQTRALLADPGNNINMVIWSWCGQLSSLSEAEVNDYLSKMNQLEKDYPKVVFIYMTGHLDGSGTAGTLNRNNEMIRTFAKTYNKVLFDFADIESYNPDGTYFLNLGATDGNDYNNYSKNWATEWCTANSTSALCATNSCAHSTSLNCNLKGRAVWWMLARLAGWSGI